MMIVAPMRPPVDDSFSHPRGGRARADPTVGVPARPITVAAADQPDSTIEPTVAMPSIEYLRSRTRYIGSQVKQEEPIIVPAEVPEECSPS